MPVAWRPANCDARIHELLTQFVNIIDPIRKMTEVAAFTVFFRIPVMGQLDLRIVIAGRRKKNEGKAALFAVVALQFPQAQLFAQPGPR